MIRRLLLKLAGRRSSSHRADVPLRPDIVLALALGGITVLSGGIAFAVFHLVVFKEVAR